jgi:uncharacterized membrane protein YcaP (DUF421 family)
VAEAWLWTDWTQVWLVVVSALAIFAAVITYTRIAGLRSFSKMSSFDFASTVAVGSLMATVAITEASLANGLIGLATIYGAQLLVASLRRRTRVASAVDNTPVLLMAGDRLLEDNLRHARVTQSDVWAKLREANVTHLDQVLAVVLETTGDISVLHGPGPLEPALLEQVKGSETLR